MVNSITSETSEKKKNVVFLFGAGAEGKDQYGMPMGGEYKKSIIRKNDELIGLINCINNEINKESKIIISKIDKSTFLSARKSSSLRQTIIETIGKDSDFKIEELPNEFDDNDKKTIVNYLNFKANNKKDRNEYAEDFYKIYKNQIYDKLSTNDANGKALGWFLDKACIYSDIDGLFNCLRKPNNYKTSTARLVKLYYSSFLALFKNEELKIAKNMSREDLKNQVNFAIEKKLNDKKDVNTYYKLVKKYKDDNPNDSIKVITTNYTELAEREIGLKYKQKQNDDEIAYLHGRLNLFENVFTKEVKDITSFQDTDFIMPFIMVQSGVKPIISPYQIKEFAKAIDFLENADIVVILGYGLNSDDEHIQTMLRECTKNKDCYCFIHLNEDSNKEDFLKNETIAKKVLGDKCICKKTSEFEDFLKEISNN